MAALALPTMAWALSVWQRRRLGVQREVYRAERRHERAEPQPQHAEAGLGEKAMISFPEAGVHVAVYAGDRRR